MASVTIHCSHGQSAQVYRHGGTLKAVRAFAVAIATTCFCSLIPMKPVKQITEMAFNDAGVRGTARTLKIGINTVIRTLKNSRRSE
ncbi:hypothetical protein AHX05_23055 [Salmonella enterica subsp. indica]|uniref:Insertion element IS1 protein InsA helix-turn-helix domain-containing protein n=1 Tax=Salmonella enterica TaxID=28901 RepID=A0A701YVV7_SALER|nr:hypothetical protein [Salmonella enterica subsp. indica]MBA3218090.1 hypothetical protein [Salmonella enterica]HAC6565152.1 hypothetical protein [Salmonella enterica subsp. indica]HBC0159533.1 hypothetical protein [Salmonella enterica subsp. indica]HCM1935183.1 hypothetical protein [Salmonella enterica subsp. indica serovar 6,7:z41:1,7]